MSLMTAARGAARARPACGRRAGSGWAPSAAAARQVAQPRVGDPVGEEQVGREAVLGDRPGTLVGARGDGRAGRACRRWRRRRAGRGGRPATRARPVQQGARARWPAVAGPAGSCAGRAPRRAHACAPLRRARARRGSPGDVRPATRTSARGSATTARTAASRASTGARSVGADRARPSTAEQDEVERPVDVDARGAIDGAGRRRRSRHARRASAAARCRWAGRAASPARRGRGRSPRCRRSSGCWRGRRGRRAAAAATNARRSAPVSSGTAPEPRTTSPPCRAVQGERPVAAPRTGGRRADRTGYGRCAAPARAKPGDGSRRGVPGRRPRPAIERCRRRPGGLGMEDDDVDVVHGRPSGRQGRLDDGPVRAELDAVRGRAVPFGRRPRRGSDPSKMSAAPSSAA